MAGTWSGIAESQMKQVGGRFLQPLRRSVGKHGLPTEFEQHVTDKQLRQQVAEPRSASRGRPAAPAQWLSAARRRA